MIQKRYLILIVFISIFFLGVSTSAAENQVIVDFYYSETCHTCLTIVPIIDNVTAHYMENYSGTVIIQKKEVGSNATNREEMRARGVSFPSVIINNETKIPRANLTYDELTEVIDDYINNLDIQRTYNQSIIYLPWIGRVNLSSFSLPILTIVLAGLDSFNPCAFFILIFLLNLLLYLQSRRRMLLVGGIFIFFSGFIYFIFMFILLNSFIFTKAYIIIISIIAGIIALIIGVLNIKDFFFFKEGPSLSIPEEKRSEIFKKMRNLVKTSYLPAILGGTIFLAVTVNFYELLCTLGFPLVYTSRLAAYNLPTTQYYLYLFLYNAVYVIPLIVILLVFTYTLGRRKLSEWGGRQLKLLSGIMIYSFGIIFIIDFKILQEVWTPIILLFLSIVLTVVISYLWKRYKKEPPEKIQEEKTIT
jgi:hypothetical protein